ncbi:hypothetical protein Slin15195_G083050 [Septoria linicola]|uniref:Uncharacterized protein n=1 Tax=Septoria linicola TaxID=215465 RepID=A0A9Q9B264_9PEZI|nr:hypothetical protein Slin14017_G085560 [Septoria linicola]USW54986.1 hypothetical protein Slin15195_G083050 [Septoria linicola]
MISSTLFALLSISVPSTIAAPLLGGVLGGVTGTVSGLTGTHLSGSGVTSLVSGVVSSGSNAARGNPAGALAPVTNIAAPVVGAASGLVAPAASVAIGAAAPVVAAGNGVVGTVSSVVGLPAPLQATCDAKYQKCTVTVSGTIENMLCDGKNFTGKASISAWMKDGRAYGSAELAGLMPAPLPYNIECNLTTEVCLGTVAGNVTQVFDNGKQVALWGWLTPQGSCKEGVCIGSLTACGDPGYKAKRGDLC